MSALYKHTQPCQNKPAADYCAAFSKFLASYSTLDFTRSPLAGKGTWCLLPTTPSMLPTATKHFDRAAHVHSLHQLWLNKLNDVVNQFQKHSKQELWSKQIHHGSQQ